MLRWFYILLQLNKLVTGLVLILSVTTISLAQETPSLSKSQYKPSERDPLLSPFELIALVPKEIDENLPLPNLKVQGMVWGISPAMCIVNGKVYAIGENVDGAQLTDIKKEGVTFKFHKKTFTVKPESELAPIKTSK